MLKVRGFQVAPAELEGHLLSHPAVADACVVGVPDGYSGEVPFAFVVLGAKAAKSVKRDKKAAEHLKRDIVKVPCDRSHVRTYKGSCLHLFSTSRMQRFHTNISREDLNLLMWSTRTRSENCYGGLCGRWPRDCPTDLLFRLSFKWSIDCISMPVIAGHWSMIK